MLEIKKSNLVLSENLTSFLILKNLTKLFIFFFFKDSKIILLVECVLTPTNFLFIITISRVYFNFLSGLSDLENKSVRR